MAPPAGRVTGLLLAWGQGDQSALEELTPLVYSELRAVARRCLGGERRGRAIQATELVNELFIKLVDIRRVQWNNRAHFFALAATLMRRILVDHARSRLAIKRGRGARQTTFDEALIVSNEPGEEIVAIDDALDALAKVDRRKARVVELRFFGGLSVEESATVLNVSADTVMRDWKLAKAWLMRAITGSDSR